MPRPDRRPFIVVAMAVVALVIAYMVIEPLAGFITLINIVFYPLQNGSMSFSHAFWMTVEREQGSI